MNEENNEERTIDIKGTIEQFIKADEPELSQEEAIIKYKQQNVESKKNNNGSDDGLNSEEQEHLKRVKQELLASLERVKKLEKQIFNEKDIEEEKKKIKVDKTSSYSGKANQVEEKQIEQKEKVDQKERE